MKAELQTLFANMLLKLFNAAQLYAGRVQVMMEFVCCVVVIQKPLQIRLDVDSIS